MTKEEQNKAESFLDAYLGGNRNVSTLTWNHWVECLHDYGSKLQSENERLIRAVKMAIRDKYMLSGRELNEVDKHTINGTTLPDSLVKRISEYTSICSIVGNDVWKI